MAEQSPKPIFVKESVPRLGLFKRRPSPEPDVALVLYREGHPIITLRPGDSLTAGEAVYGKYQTVYKVDVSEHSFSFQCALPCEGDAFEFQADVHVVYTVSNPAAIVERNITDARGALEPLIMRTLRATSRKFGVEQSAKAERALMRAIEGEEYDIGLKVKRFVVKLQLDRVAREHIRKIEEIKLRTEREKAEIEGLKVVEAAQAALDEERREFEKDKAEWELEQKQRLMQFYSPLIERGDWQLLALQLANNPDDVEKVAGRISQERQAAAEKHLEFLKIALETGAIEEWEMNPTAKQVLRRFIDSVDAALGIRALQEPEDRKALAPGKGEQPTNSESESTEDDSD